MPKLSKLISALPGEHFEMAEGAARSAGDAREAEAAPRTAQRLDP